MDNVYLKKFSDSKAKGLNYLKRGIEILKILINRGYDSYIVSNAVTNFYLCQDIDEIEIVTKANFNELIAIFPSIIKNKKEQVIYNDPEGSFSFIFFDDPKLPIVLNENLDKHYNKKLIQVLQSKIFTLKAMALSPNYEIIDIFNSILSIDEHIIKAIDKTKSVFEINPANIFEALVLHAHYGFMIEKKTLKAMYKMQAGLNKIELKDSIVYLKQILKGRFAKETLLLINKEHLFKAVPDFDSFVIKLLNSYDKLNEIERYSLLYLIIGLIPDAYLINKLELEEITETITITQLISHSEVTPMMVYNIGVDKLLSCDKLALTYKKDYKSQAKLIHKLKKNAVINSIRELNISELELIKLFNGQRNIKIRIVENLLLEKVINQEIKNYPKVLREEALKIDQEMKEIFNYEEKEPIRDDDEDAVTKLLEKYHRELDFLIKVYLNDEKELYSLSPAERNDLKKEAEQHAHDFLLQTSQYQILEERRLI